MVAVKKEKTNFCMLLFVVVCLAGSLLLMGLTLGQATILATWQGVPSVRVQILVFLMLIAVGAVAISRMSYPEE